MLRLVEDLIVVVNFGFKPNVNLHLELFVELCREFFEEFNMLPTEHFQYPLFVSRVARP